MKKKKEMKRKAKFLKWINLGRLEINGTNLRDDLRCMLKNVKLLLGICTFICNFRRFLKKLLKSIIIVHCLNEMVVQILSSLHDKEVHHCLWNAVADVLLDNAKV